MKKTLLHLPLSIALFLSTTVAQASLDMWKSATVKVISTPCLVQKPRFEGSGLVVRLQNRLFVLTSEHVIIDDSSSRLCHAVKNSENAETPAKLLRSDFMMGMALLELSADSTYGAVAIDVNSLEDLPNAAGSLTALGFPAGDSQLQVHQQGRLISSDSQRALIPMVSKMLEVDGLLVEFGFSGGVLTDETHNTFAGMITHQYLRRESGRPTKPGGLNGDSGEAIRPGDLALVIPAATVMDWLRSSLKVSQNND
ncbi:MAG: trypsin-like peptidase domain-containing protein, partial [Limisphaerales bacterium]